MSQTPSKPGQKMCKSPKNSTNYHNIKHEKIDYESLSTNCTVVGSNNLNLVKKPQIVTSMSPAYSNTNSSPVYPASPYSSPASLKSPSPSLKPPTPQPQTFPVMQIIHNNHHLLARPIQQQQQQNIIKLKPHLNILPKPSGSPQPSPKASVSPQIMIPTNTHQQTTLMQSAQPLLLNQMPMLAATPGVQFILKPQTTTKMQTATPQGLILQQGSQPIIQLQPPRSQPMVRVLTNSVQIAPSTTTPTTYVQMGNLPITNNTSPNLSGHSPQQGQNQLKKKPKTKVKKKLDLANIMKLSGIGDEDDIQFESDASQSENEHNPGSTTPQPQQQIQMQASTIQAQNIMHQTEGKKIGGIQIQGIAQPTLNAAATPVVQVLNQNFQSGMISNSTSQASGQTGIPFSPFITPNFTINNGLMVQRSGGFKLAMSEDGRLVLQHDPTLNQDLQSQLILQSIFGLNGGLVIQPSIDQQTVQQTVQTIQQQSVQTIQQQTVQSQTIQTVQQQTVQPQTVQHSIQALQPQIQQQTVQQTIQHQTVQSQPITAIQQPMQIVQPQPIHSMQSQVQPSVHSIQSHVHSLQSQLQGQIHNLLQQQNHTIQNHPPQSIQTVQPIQHQPIQTLASIPQQSPVQSVQHNVHSHQSHSQPVLKVQPFQKSQLPVQTVHPQPVQTVQPQPIQAVQPVQAVHPQPIHSQLPIQTIHQNQQNMDGNNQQQPTSYVVNLTPDQLEQLKRNGQLTVNGQTIYMPRSNQLNKQNDNNSLPEKKLSPKIKPVKKLHKIQAVKNLTQENIESVKPVITINHQVNKEVKNALLSPTKNVIQAQPVQPQQTQSQKPVQPSAMVQPQPMIQSTQKQLDKTKVQNLQKIQSNTQITQNNESNGNNQDVDKLLGQLLEESNNINIITSSSNVSVPTPNFQHQRIHTIQLTPQKQQHLKNIQVQIQSLSGQLSSGNGNADIQNALKNLFAEQQKILATGKLLPPDKVYYHNNQLTIVNPSSLNSPPPGVIQAKSEPSPTSVQTQHSNNNIRRNVTDPTPTYQQSLTTQALPSPRIPTSMPLTENVPQHIHQQQQTNIQQQLLQHNPIITNQAHNNQQTVNNQQHQQHNVNQAVSPKTTNNTSVTTNMPPPIMQLSPQQQYNSIAKKAHLIEAQLTQDQAGAVQPDVHSPFKDKKDACIRLIRYHCMDQPVLSQKDLNKADEIFELTARHFIAKYDKMVDKYKYLLLKESQRQVQTSELMMLDRLFLNDEQQSLLRLRQEADEAQYLDLNPIQVPEPPPPPLVNQNIRHQHQVSQNHLSPHNQNQAVQNQHQFGHSQLQNQSGHGQLLSVNIHQNVHNQYQSGHSPRISSHQFVQSNQQSHVQAESNQSHSRMLHPNQNHQQQINQNNQSNNSNISNYSHHQSVQNSIQSHNEHQMTSSHNQNVQNQSNSLSNEEYDEWACIQRELGCLPNDDHKSNFVEPTVPEHSNNAHQQHHKRSASSDSRLETLKRFRVEKHHKKTSDSVHNSVNNVVQSVSNSLTQNTHLTMTSQSCMTSRYQSSYDNQHTYNSLETEDGIEGKSIDEQVQSAIDSILNLQQNTPLDLDSILS